MYKQKKINRLVCIVILATIILGGCTTFGYRSKGYSIEYKLKNKNIVLSKSPKQLNVQVARFYDTRPLVEREKSARKNKSDRDINDYTYDNEFKGNVNEKITKMMIEHINYSKVFTPEVTLASLGSEQVSDASLDYLAETGIDAIMTGEIEHFYGYYDQKPFRKILYRLPLQISCAVVSLGLSMAILDGKMGIFTTFPGGYFGNYIESLHKRHIAQHVLLKVRLISTKTHKKLWEESFDVSFNGRKNIPGFSIKKRKFQIVILSLQDAINKIVKSLENTNLSVEKNKN